MGCDTYVLKQFAIGRPNSNPMSIASGLMLGNPEIQATDSWAKQV
jgi:hypothetical protein